MYNDTVTLFNLHNNMWYPRIIHNADFGVTNGATNTQLNGKVQSDRATILISTYSDKRIPVAEKYWHYISPKGFAALENVDNAYTFQPQTDFIIIGEYESTEVIVDDNFETGFYDYVNSTRDGVYLISAVAYYSLIPHFEIEVT